ncbi:MAG TPA: protein-methionine-sulfoxide reductase heme-binding subunit MsrQ [Vicinamibacterales bacterium]|nr:protein-methionine-sulfoxide reductase heme-binding subunit MsrQ [Vicinamibacterales bacterium]
MKPIVLLKRAIFAAALIPAAALAADAYRGELTANPIEYITHTTGDWAIRFLIITLAVTPIRRVTGWNPIIQLRRMLGLFAFFYATLHFLTWFVLDWFFDFRQMVKDIAMRPFITLGMATFVMLLALAVTSTQGSIRRLGRRWTQLHRLIYVAACTALFHFWLARKTVVPQFQVLLVAGVVLLGFRAWWTLRTRTRARPRVDRALGAER